MNDMYDVFISYRRDGGHEMARLIYESLNAKGIKCFFDLEELGAGVFDVKLLKNIEESKNFVLILSPGSLERCRNEGDWVRAEIEHAIKEKKNIVPLLMPGFAWPEGLPESLATLALYNGVQIVREYFGASMSKLVNMLVIDHSKLTSEKASKQVNETAPLLERAFIFLEDKEWSKADEYAEKVLDLEPKNGEAYLVKLMAKLRVDKRENLKGLPNPFDRSDNYKNVLRYADDELKNELEGYLEHINFVNEQKIKRAYDKAVADMESAQTEDDYRNVAKAFRDLSDYLDSAAHAGECEKKADIAVYEQAMTDMESAVTYGEYMALSCKLSAISYKDSKALGEDCRKKAEIIQWVEEGGHSSRFKGMSEIEVPKGVTRIGDGAFSSCDNLTSITIPDSVTSIENEAFRGCKNLTSIIIPNSVTSIGNRAFSNCEKLTSIIIPNSVTSIGFFAFSNCEKLTSITIPNSVTSIENEAFRGCKNLTSITIPNSVTSIGGWAFSGCRNLTSITIPNSVTSIGGEAFSSCDNLTSITIPNSVTSIWHKAFFDCEKLTSITIPNSVKSIGGWAFSGCRNLTSIIIPNSVTNIGDGAFSSCDNLTSITIPNSVTSIGFFAFSKCKKLTSITIPDSVTSIEKEAFRDCKNLTSITIPDSVTSIGYGAFQDCENLTSITIPDSVTSIGENAFLGCNNLKNVVYKGTRARWNAISCKCGYTSGVTCADDKSGGCYIATCVYGSYDCPQVWMLRRFRDDSLVSNVFGRAFIRLYYAVSPTLVRIFGKSKLIKSIWKAFTDSLVAKLRKKGVEDTPYDDLY